MAGSKIYTIIGVIIFGFLTYTMFMNNFKYISMDYANECIEQGGVWNPDDEECVLEQLEKEVK